MAHSSISNSRAIMGMARLFLPALLMCSPYAIAGNIFEARYTNQADAKIYLVKYANQAKWRKSNRFRGFFKHGT